MSSTILFGFPEQSIVIPAIPSAIQYNCACGLPIKFFIMRSTFSRSKPPRKLHGRRPQFSGTKERREASIIALKPQQERGSELHGLGEASRTEIAYCDY